jgi:hypothetical protein
MQNQDTGISEIKYALEREAHIGIAKEKLTQAQIQRNPKKSGIAGLVKRGEEIRSKQRSSSWSIVRLLNTIQAVH